MSYGSILRKNANNKHLETLKPLMEKIVDDCNKRAESGDYYFTIEFENKEESELWENKNVIMNILKTLDLEVSLKDKGNNKWTIIISWENSIK